MVVTHNFKTTTLHRKNPKVWGIEPSYLVNGAAGILSKAGTSQPGQQFLDYSSQIQLDREPTINFEPHAKRCISLASLKKRGILPSTSQVQMKGNQ